MLKNKITDLIKKTGLLSISPTEDPVIGKLMIKFEHKERSFIYGHIKRLVDCLYCHAAPGTLEMTLSELRASVPDTKGRRLLNLGGGTGQVANILTELGYEVFNLDLDVKPENETSHNLSCDLNSTNPLPTEKGSFDVVLCQEIIEHLENPWKLFRDASASLKPGGLLILSTPNIQSSYSRLRFFLTGYHKWFSPGCFDYHINPLPDWEIRLIANRTGFRLEKLRGSGDFFFDRNNSNEKEIIHRNEELIYLFTRAE